MLFHFVELLGVILSPIALTVAYLIWAKRNWRALALATFVPILAGVEWLFYNLLLWPTDSRNSESVGDGFVMLPGIFIMLTMIVIYYGIAIADGISWLIGERRNQRDGTSAFGNPDHTSS